MNRKSEIIGLALGSIAGVFLFNWWQQSREASDNKVTDTGEKTPDGSIIIEVTGVGGADNGVKVRGYALPSSIDDIKLPLTVIVKPNRNLFIDFKVGQKVTFVKKNGDEIIWIGKIGDAGGDYTIWYPELIKSALGAV